MEYDLTHFNRWFPSDKPHGSVMPAASAVPAMQSYGYHETKPKKDYRKAAHYTKVREDLPYMTRYWSRQGALQAA